MNIELKFKLSNNHDSAIILQNRICREIFDDETETAEIISKSDGYYVLIKTYQLFDVVDKLIQNGFDI